LLALDDYDADLSNGDTVSESARALWHGNVGQTSNRWWDKSIQWIISEDYCGLVGEHSLVDGMPALNLSRYCFDNSQRVEDEDDDCSLHDEQHLVATPVFQHVWDRLSESDRDGIQYHIKRAKDEVINQIGDYDLEVLEYKRYGTKRLRESTFQPSADAWAQMAMQWASTLILGEGSSRPVATYESVQTRRFLHGRTATTRSVSSASAAWVQSMIQGQDSLSRQQELLQRALESHVQYTRQASAAEGIDRHLFGLQMLVGADEAVPDLFQDPLYMRSKRWRLSTSTLPGSAPGFGPVQADGVGIGYDLSLDDIWNFTITARQEHQWVQPMRKQLSECLDSMEVFLEDTVFPQSRM
jgi:carnitine O-acetyltransferase